MSFRKETVKGAITVSRVYKNDYQKKGTLTAEIKQIVTTHSWYPSAKVDNNMQANVFSASECGFTETHYESGETRVAWIPVPEGTKIEDVQTRLDAAFKNGACIYRVLSSAPILTDDQKYAINQGLRTLDQFADSQAVRYPDNAQTQADGTANKLVKDSNGNPFYRRTFFWNVAQADHDLRGQEEVYLTPKMKAELSGASILQGQTI